MCRNMDKRHLREMIKERVRERMTHKLKPFYKNSKSQLSHFSNSGSLKNQVLISNVKSTIPSNATKYKDKNLNISE